jgi:hypothetical protein
MDQEFPAPVRLPGEPPLPREPRAPHDRPEPPAVVDDDADRYGAEAASAALAARLEALTPGPGLRTDDGHRLLSPPFDETSDRVDGLPGAPATLVVFGAHATPWSGTLATVLAAVRETSPTTVAIAWRHYPDPVAHPRAAVLALAAEAAAERGRFWPFTRELLKMRHHGPDDLHAAMVRVGLDPERALEAMRAGAGADRVVADAQSALTSGALVSPTLFVDGARYEGELDPDAVAAALRR